MFDPEFADGLSTLTTLSRLGQGDQPVTGDRGRISPLTQGASRADWE